MTCAPYDGAMTGGARCGGFMAGDGFRLARRAGGIGT